MRKHRLPIDELRNQGDGALQTITVYLPKKWLKALESLLAETGISRSEWVRDAFLYYLDYNRVVENWIQGKVDKAEVEQQKKDDEIELYMQKNGYNKIRRLE